jgi:osmoprotectant transport system permease protein
MALLAGCGSSGSPSTTLHMATKPMTEQHILGYMMKDLIEKDTKLKVDITLGVGGGTANIEPAMEKGEFDFYPEYTGTGWNAVLKKKEIYKESMFPELKAGYDSKGFTWTEPLGFNNTYGLAVKKELADLYHLETYSDLARVADQMTFGAEYDFFERKDGYEALSQMYGLHFKATRDMDIGLKYDAMKQGKIDVMNIFTTDGQLSIADVKVLKDDKELYPSYMCRFVVRNQVLADHPELKDVFAKIAGKISDEEMAHMNYQVEAEGKQAEDVAKDFLKAKGLL